MLPPPAAHMRVDGTDRVQAREPVGADEAFDVLLVHLLEQAEPQRVLARAGTAADEDVDATETRRHSPGQRVELRRVVKVRSLEVGLPALGLDLVHDRCTGLRVAAADDHSGTVPRQAHGDRAADVPRSTGHQRDRVLQAAFRRPD